MKQKTKGYKTFSVMINSYKPNKLHVEKHTVGKVRVWGRKRDVKRIPEIMKRCYLSEIGKKTTGGEKGNSIEHKVERVF